MNEVSNETIEEINNVLKGNLKDWNIKQYSKDNLWEESDLNGKIIVIWDGFYGEGSSDVPLKQFITPVIWALAYKEHHPKSQLNIKILDLYSHLGQIEFHEKVIEFHQKILTNEEIKKWLKFYSFNKQYFSCVSSPFDILKNERQENET